MILCHKCAGVLAGDESETQGLHGCGCISGWVRGTEPNLTRAEGIAAQIRACQFWIDLYTRQGRESFWIESQQKQIAKLSALAIAK